MKRDQNTGRVQLIGIKRRLTRALARSVVFAQRSLFRPHTRPSFPPAAFLHHTARVASSFLLFLLWPMLVHMVLPGAPYGHCVFWMACLCIWSLVPALPLSCSPPGALLQMAMTKDVFGGSRVIHGQNCPISDEISQKLDLYSDRPKRGRVYAGRASQSSTHGGRPRFFPAAQILHEVRSVNVFAHRHTLGQTRPVRMHTP